MLRMRIYKKVDDYTVVRSIFRRAAAARGVRRVLARPKSRLDRSERRIRMSLLEVMVGKVCRIVLPFSPKKHVERKTVLRRS